jgi:phage terminase small subunit
MSQGQPKELTEKQRLFITHLSDHTSKTFANITRSLQAAGYKHGKSPEATAIRLLANKRVLEGLIKGVVKTSNVTLIRQESAKERIWQELEEALSECKTSGDMTNRLRVIELMGKFHQLWSDKVTISVETYEKMSEEHMHELLELSKLRHLRSGSIVDAQLTEPASTTIDDNSGPVDCQGIDSAFIQGCSDAIADDAGIQAVVGDSSDTDNTSTIALHNDTQVIDNT